MGDGHGGSLALSYSGANLTRVADAANAGRYLQIDYAADGVHVADVKDPAGRTVQYTIAGGDLTGTTDVMGRHVTYLYNAHLLTEIDNNLGQAEEKNTYDLYAPAGRVIAQTEQDGTGLAMDYQADHTTVTTTGADGATTETTTYQYDVNTNTLTGVARNGVTVGGTAFDAHLAAGQITDGDSNSTQIATNGLGQPTQVQNALSQISSVHYDAQSRPDLQTDPLLRQTKLAYDANNNPTLVTTGITAATPNGLATGYQYQPCYAGASETCLLQQTDPSGVATRYAYDAQGQVTGVTVGYGTARAITTGYGYDGLGRVTAVTYGQGSPLQRVDATVYNADNTVSRTIRNKVTGSYDPAHPDRDIVTDYGYDALGRALWQRDTLGRVSVTHHNAQGQVDWTLQEPAAGDAGWERQPDDPGRARRPTARPSPTPTWPRCTPTTRWAGSAWSPRPGS